MPTLSSESVPSSARYLKHLSPAVNARSSCHRHCMLRRYKQNSHPGLTSWSESSTETATTHYMPLHTKFTDPLILLHPHIPERPSRFVRSVCIVEYPLIEALGYQRRYPGTKQPEGTASSIIVKAILTIRLAKRPVS